MWVKVVLVVMKTRRRDVLLCLFDLKRSSFCATSTSGLLFKGLSKSTRDRKSLSSPSSPYSCASSSLTNNLHSPAAEEEANCVASVFE